MSNSSFYSCPASLKPIVSLLLSQYGKAHHTIEQLFSKSTFSKPLIHRITITLSIIHILIWLQTVLYGGATTVMDMNSRGVNQVRILDLQKPENGDLRVEISEGTIFDARDENRSYSESHNVLRTGAASSLMQDARNSAAEACRETGEQDEVVHTHILVRPSNADASAYFSLQGNESVAEAIQGGFLFGCLESQIDDGEGSLTQVQRDLVLTREETGADEDNLGFPALKQASSVFIATKALLNLTLASLGLLIFYSYACSSAQTPELKEPATSAPLLAHAPKPQPTTKRPSTPIPLIKKQAPQKLTPIVPSPTAAPASAISQMTDDELVHSGLQNEIRLYSLEAQLGDATRAVEIRRRIVAAKIKNDPATSSFVASGLPFKNYDYPRVAGACCENVIGYLPVPVGVAGPLNINGRQVFLPMATTEGALVASTNRGCTAINASGGAISLVLGDGMTRGPCVRFPNLTRAAAAKLWLDSEDGWQTVEKAFNSTSRFGRLQNIKCAIAGSELFIRFKARTGDAMGMNMISKGVERALAAIVEAGFPDMSIISVSGNYCTDKKAAAINWIDGRGKSVVAQATIPAATVKKVLKTDVDRMVELNVSKNLVGSSLAGSIGGFNAHAANIVSAIFLATGQDIAQNVESSSCLTTMQNIDGDLQISVSMPSIEVGTVGGGTVLEAQGTMLDLLGIRGANGETPGANAQELACIVAAGVLAGELSLCSALAVGSLVSSHMALNRK